MKFAFTCQNNVHNTNIYNEMYDIIKIYVPNRNEMLDFGLNEKKKKKFTTNYEKRFELFD